MHISLANKIAVVFVVILHCYTVDN